YPNVVQEVKDRLLKLHEAGAAMTVLTVRGVMLALIISRALEILETPYKDGSTFRASNNFVCK
ncbi:hypothetical protein BYT27DRAFT_7103781, partial [Phlegmacium glaucopus]